MEIEGASGRPLIFTVFECALAGLGVHHREACTSLMQFFGTLIRAGILSFFPFPYSHHRLYCQLDTIAMVNRR
jgi:hypothetical protein